ncbi:MAG: winged helix-turn-helix domain-containing protein, partial [Candidatus Hermodarchaeota archaeon]
DKRPKNCKLLDSCTTLIEKSTFKILKKYMNKGPSAALKLLKKYDEVSTNYIKTGKCPDEKCLDNSLKIIKSLEDIFRSSEQTFIKQTKDLFSQVNEYCMSEGTEKNECKLLSPLTNETRLKILKVLNRGGAYYTQLERNVGLKGGHFHFHLNKLINAGYISQEEEKGPYLITTRALKALKFMHDMKQEFLIENIVK